MSNGIWRLNSRASLREGPNGDEGILLDTYTADICSCNGTAWTILQIIKKGAAIKQIVAGVRKEYDVSMKVAERDVLSFVRKLKSMELVDGQ